MSLLVEFHFSISSNEKMRVLQENGNPHIPQTKYEWQAGPTYLKFIDYYFPPFTAQIPVVGWLKILTKGVLFTRPVEFTIDTIHTSNWDHLEQWTFSIPSTMPLIGIF